MTDNPNTIAGGTINGPGILGADTGSALVGFGTINANIDFDGTANLRAGGGTLTVTSAILDANVVGVNNVPGVLNVTNSWNTNVTASVELLGGRIEGAAINNDGAGGINGFGEIAAAVRNNTSINTEGGTLRVTNAASDWDGPLGAGSLNANAGNLELVDNASFPFTGTVSAASGFEVFANGFELEFEPTSTLSLTGGTYRSTEARRTSAAR